MIGQSVENGRIVLKARIQNTGKVTAPLVRLSLRDRKTKARVLPALYSENYFWLIPGEERWITVSTPQGSTGNAKLALKAQGYGTDAVTAVG